MTAEEFIKTVQKCGYGTKKGAEKYVELNPKEDYSMNDLIVLHEGNMHWQGVSGDKGLGYAGTGWQSAKSNESPGDAELLPEASGRCSYEKNKI